MAAPSGEQAIILQILNLAVQLNRDHSYEYAMVFAAPGIGRSTAALGVSGVKTFCSPHLQHWGRKGELFFAGDHVARSVEQSQAACQVAKAQRTSFLDLVSSQRDLVIAVARGVIKAKMPGVKDTFPFQTSSGEAGATMNEVRSGPCCAP